MQEFFENFMVSDKISDKIQTGMGEFSKDKFRALIHVRADALQGIETALTERDYTKVTTSSLLNIVGSCENPNASFTLNYYGREAHLSQSAQIQLEALTMRLREGVYTVNNSFREEDYVDPATAGRRLSEFTLVEPEKPYPDATAQEALDQIIDEQEHVIKFATNYVLTRNRDRIETLEGDVGYLERATENPFNRVTYDEALDILRSATDNSYEFGHDLGIADEKVLLKHFDNIPTFVTDFPTSIKFFNMKRHDDGDRCYSVDLLMPRLGETTGGAVREEDGEVIKENLRDSKIGEFLKSKGKNPVEPFTEYFNVFDQENPMLRGGYGIGFERFAGFLLQSNDILNTISYRICQAK